MARIQWTISSGSTYLLNATPYPHLDENQFDLTNVDTGEKVYSNLTREAAIELVAALQEGFNL